MANIDVICGNCGASAPAPEDGTSVKCMFCGSSIKHIKTDMKSDSQDPKVASLMSLAESAKESQNYEEAYTYFNRALELDVENPGAWLGKGLAAVWQSTLANTRTSEMLPAFKNALKYSGNDEAIGKTLKEIAEGGGDAFLALCNLAAGHYAEYGSTYSEFGQLPDHAVAAEGRSYVTTFVDEYLELYTWISEEEATLEERSGKTLHLDLPSDYYMVEILDYIWCDISVAGLDYPVGLWNEIMYKEDLNFVAANKDSLGEMSHPWSGRQHVLEWDIYGMYAFAVVNRHEQRNYDEISEEYKEKYEIHDPREHILVSDKDPGSCFIATAVYGTRTHPDLTVLRYFRDSWLRNRAWGDAFISFYYQHGPKAAERVSAHPLIKACVKPLVLLGVAIAKKLQ
jgi:tetratricopeptide (TPR) repeat protein